MKIHHGGKLVETLVYNQYIGDKVDYYDWCVTWKVSIVMLDKIALALNYGLNIRYYYIDLSVDGPLG